MVISCAGCGWPAPPPRSVTPFRCPRAGRPGDDVDHVLVRRLPADAQWPSGDEVNPFVRYRSLLSAHDRAESDADFLDIVQRLDDAVAEVDGRGFVVTPFAPNESLGAWVKDETGNVGGSHKGRHLMGLAIWLDVVQIDRSRPLAIASCGNAALAAAVIARAAARPLTVHVPTWADAAVIDRLRELGAAIEVVPPTRRRSAGRSVCAPIPRGGRLGCGARSRAKGPTTGSRSTAAGRSATRSPTPAWRSTT